MEELWSYSLAYTNAGILGIFEALRMVLHLEAHSI
jgi:hypothetical protein